jgi:HK97 gp10 family phage protein
MADEVLFISALGSDISGAFEAVKEQTIQAEVGAMTKACLAVERDAKVNCPVDTGLTRDSITSQVERDGDEVVGYVGSNAEQAPYIHQGTGIYAKDGNGRKEVPWVYRDAKGEFHSTMGQKPRPFVQDAIDTNRDTILRYFAAVLGGGSA